MASVGEPCPLNVADVAEQSADGMLVMSHGGRIAWVNAAMCRLLGWSEAEMLGQPYSDFGIPPELLEDAVDADFQELVQEQCETKTGEEISLEFSFTVLNPDSANAMILIAARDAAHTAARDASKDRMIADLQTNARFDSLTGLYNRGEFARLAEAHLWTEAPEMGLLQLDLNKFKTINDTLGHEAGDRVLQHVGDALRAVARPEDITCRLGGDEFVMAIPKINDFDELTRIATELRDAINTPFEWMGHKLQPSAAIGISIWGSGEDTPDDLMRRADFALYDAKASPDSRIACYNADLHARYVSETRLLAQFNEALNSDGIGFVYQPIVDPERNIVGFETLARCTIEDGTQIPPLTFFEFARQLKRTHEIDIKAMRAALEMRASTRACGTELQACFNTSTETLLRPDFKSLLQWEADRLALSPETITIEVLETTFFGADARQSTAAHAISDLRALGFNVVLDDFGVGYAGLSHLDSLEITGLKIDMALVADAVVNPNVEIITRTLVDLVHKLGLTILAEGIETDKQMALFRDAGCELMQGYLFGYPVDHDAFLDLLGGHSSLSNIRDLYRQLG